MITYKPGIIDALRKAGYNSVRIRNEKIFGEKTMQDFRHCAEIPYPTLNKLCKILGCPLSAIIEYVPDELIEAEKHLQEAEAQDTDVTKNSDGADTSKSAFDPEVMEARRVADRQRQIDALQHEGAVVELKKSKKKSHPLLANYEREQAQQSEDSQTDTDADDTPLDTDAASEGDNALEYDGNIFDHKNK